MEKNYLDISRASDIKEKKDRIIYRLFEILPGFLSVVTLSFALIFSWLQPVWVAIFIIIFDLYWTLKIIYLIFHQFSSFFRMKKNLRADWKEKLESVAPSLYGVKLSNWQDIYHLVILPSYKESVEIIEENLKSLKAACYPKEKMIIVLALEERAGEEARKTAQIIERKYKNYFGYLLITFHPKDIPGEAIGKGSNVSWAGKKAKQEIIDVEGISLEQIIVSSFDIDTRVYSQYFLCLTYNYLTCKVPSRTSFQPISVFHNNLWYAPIFSRVVANSSTIWQMMQQERPEQLTTFSSHSIAGVSFFEVGYPHNLIPDDSRMFWKCLLKFDGNYEVIPLHYPTSMDMVVSTNIFRAFLNQYKQQKRWAWGCTEIPYVLFCFLKNKKIALKKKIFRLLVIFEGFWSWACAPLLILFLGWLPLFLGGEEFNITLFSYNLPRMTSRIMAFAMIGMLASAITNVLFLPKRPKGVSKIKTLLVFFQWLILPFTLVVLSALPALDAQVRLMLGKYMEFWNTPKVREN